jgi:hypothetical protein
VAEVEAEEEEGTERRDNLANLVIALGRRSALNGAIFSVRDVTDIPSSSSSSVESC